MISELLCLYQKQEIYFSKNLEKFFGLIEIISCFNIFYMALIFYNFTILELVLIFYDAFQYFLR